MTTEQHYGAHSAHVEMWLIVKGSSISITQMGPDFLFLEPPEDHPPGDAAIVLKVDQNQRRWNVHLPGGISAESNRVTIAMSEGYQAAIIQREL